MPIPVKTRPRFKCQFCLSYRATLRAVERHEGFCWQNPERFCETCKNTGLDPEYNAKEDYPEAMHCRYCSKEQKDLTATLKIYNAQAQA